MFRSPEKNLKHDASDESASHIEGPRQITPELIDNFRKATGFHGTDEEAARELMREIRKGIKEETE